MKSELRLENVSAGYGALEVCQGIDLELFAGKVNVITGPNGAGKTSLLRRLAGQCGGSGRIWLGESQIGSLPAHERARLGMLFVPDARGLLSDLTTSENIELAAILLPRAERAQAVERAHARFPVIAERGRTPVGALSGGEQQMVALARVLMLRPRVVLLDEPSQGLAPRVVAEVARVIDEIRQAGSAVLLVEQDLGLAAAVADSVAVLIDGRITMRREGAELLASEEALAEAYLGVLEH